MAAPMKWCRDGGEGMVSSAKIAGIEITAGVGDKHAVRATLVSTSDMLGHAEQRAALALREMHDALVEHFAPVLRWECDLHSVATLGQWFLQADSEEWSVMVCPPNAERSVVASGDRCTTRENNRRAAEAALRALGVVFRVEGES